MSSERPPAETWLADVPTNPPTWQEGCKLATEDPGGNGPTGDLSRPLAKCHDDKALAVIQFSTNGTDADAPGWSDGGTEN